MDKKQVLLLSGLQYVGKSWLAEELKKHPSFSHGVYIDIDDVRVTLFGERKDAEITKEEHLFKNESFRREIYQALVRGTSLVVAQAVMLTRKNHQLPMLEIMKDKSIELRVALLYSDFKTIKRRMAESQAQRKKTNTPVFNLAGMWGAYSQFEFPDESTYEPLYLNTSDESKEAQESRIKEVENFLDGKLDSTENERRKNEAMNIFEEVKKAVGETHYKAFDFLVLKC